MSTQKITDESNFKSTSTNFFIIMPDNNKSAAQPLPHNSKKPFLT